jgi:transposase-like protein
MKVIKNSIEAHRARFGTEEQCYTYLAQTKWKDGFICKDCGHNEYIKGRKNLDRRCKKCKKSESPTSGTLFHSIKIPLVKVFEIIYRVSVNKKGLSCISIAREYDLNQKTAVLLRDKIQRAMKSSGKHPLLGEVHVDEFLIGGPEELKQGRSNDSKKKKATLAVEILPKKKSIGRLYVRQIEDFSSSELRKIFDTHIDKQAIIKTDSWTGYSPLKQEYTKLIQKNSDKGRAFPELHVLIMNLKSWIKGIHHRISKTRFQKYLDEFSYRFNRRNFIPTIVTNLINRMCLAKPIASINTDT